MIPPLASFWVDFTFFFCPPALFSPGNRRLSPRRFIGQLSYILHMCVGVCVCECVRCSFGQGPNVLERNERICRYLLHTSSSICCIWMQSLGNLMIILFDIALLFFPFLIFISPLFKSRGDHWGQALIYNDVESTAEQRDKWQQKPNIAKNGYI